MLFLKSISKWGGGAKWISGRWMNINNGVKGEKSMWRNNTMWHKPQESRAKQSDHGSQLRSRCWFYWERKTGEPGEKPSKHGTSPNYKTGTWTVVKLKCSGHVSEFRTEIKPVTFWFPARRKSQWYTGSIDIYATYVAVTIY